MNTIDLSLFKKILIWLFKFILGAFLIFLIYFFHQKSVTIWTFQINNPLYQYVEHHPWWMYIVVYLIIISIFNIILLGILNFYFTIRQSYIEKQNKYYEALFTDLLVDYLVSNDINDWEKSDIMLKIKKHARTKAQVIALFTIFTRLQDITSDDLSKQFTILLKTIQMKYKLEQLLSSYNFSNKILALRVISYLKIQTHNQLILKFTQSNNYALRTEAITALIRLNATKNLSFLIDYSHHLSMLDVNVIVIDVLENPNVEVDYDALLHSEVPNKILIAVLIAKYRRQVSVKDMIKALIGHSDETLNTELWETYLHLEDDEQKSIQLITSKFSVQTEKVKLAILKKGVKTDDPVYYEFITRIVYEDESILVKTRAMNLLFNYNFTIITQFSGSDDPYVIRAYKEIIDFSDI